MKKKLTIIGIILAIVLIVLIGNKLYLVHEENAVKEKFLERFSELEVKDVKFWNAHKYSSPTGIVISVDLEEEQKEEFCAAMKSVVPEEITIGKNASKAKIPQFYIYSESVGEWQFLFDGEAAYIVGAEEGANETYREWPWEIKNEKLTELFSSLFE